MMGSDLERRIAALSPAKRAIFERSRAAAATVVAPPLLTSRGSEYERTIVMRSTGSEPPFFFCHGDLSGAGFYCRDVLSALDAEQPFYVFTPHGIDGDPLPFTIEEMAQEFLQTLRRIAPHGPYRLGGFCSGGLVAFEIARRLRAEGERVEHLVLLDTSGRNTRFAGFQTFVARIAILLRLSPNIAPKVTGYVSSRFYEVLEQFRSDGPSCWLFLGRKLRSVVRRLTRTAVQSRDADLASGPEELEQRWRLVRYRYAPRRYDGPLTLLLADRRNDAPDHATLLGRWRVAVPHVEMRTVPGDHLSCIAEHLGQTSAIIAGCLAKGQTG